MGHNRSRKEDKLYVSYIKSKINKADSSCDFCDIHAGSHQLVRQTEHFKIIRNIFPYSIWDGRRVTEHLMLVPNIHTETLSTLSPLAMQEYILLISEYESAGYNIYARTPGSTMKSVPHQHTHLIKAGGKRVKAVAYISRPYFRMAI